MDKNNELFSPGKKSNNNTKGQKQAQHDTQIYNELFIFYMKTCCSLWQRLCVLTLGENRSRHLAFLDVVNMKWNDSKTAPKYGWRDLWILGNDAEGASKLLRTWQTSNRRLWKTWQGSGLTSLRIGWSNVRSLRGVGKVEHLSPPSREGKEDRSSARAWVTPLLRGGKDILTFVWGMWRVVVLFLAGACRWLTNPGISPASAQAQDSHASSSWSAHPLVLNCSTALLSAVAAAWPGFFWGGRVDGVFPSICTSHSSWWMRTLLWRTAGRLWINARPLHKSMLLLTMTWRGATRCGGKVEVVVLVPGYLSTSLSNCQHRRDHKSFLRL